MATLQTLPGSKTGSELLDLHLYHSESSMCGDTLVFEDKSNDSETNNNNNENIQQN